MIHKLVDSLPYLEDLLNVFAAVSILSLLALYPSDLNHLQNSQSPKAFLFDVKSRLYVATDASPVDTATYNLCCDYLQMLNSFRSLYKYELTRFKVSCSLLIRSNKSATPSLPPPPPPSAAVSPFIDLSEYVDTTDGSPSSSSTATNEVSYPSASTSLLSTGSSSTTLTFHMITPHLALLALLPTSVFDARRGLVEYNVVFFRDGVKQIWEAESEARVDGV